MPRGGNKTREIWKTRAGVFDQFTFRTLHELGTKGHFDDLESPIKIGKESNIFTGLRKDGTRVIAKIYRLETVDFNRMFEYISHDQRFVGLRKQRRKIIFAWVQREYRNLLNAREAGVRVPLAMAFKNNVLVEEFIGDPDGPAPQLKDEPPKHPVKFFELLKAEMKKLFKAGLVHGDLSAFNILNFHDEPVIIDLSTTTTREDSNYAKYWRRDVHNVVAFFAKCGLSLDEEKVYKEITQK